jgi:hypothetical protein
MYIKPHANNFTTQSFVREMLKSKNFIITLEGDFDAEYISEGACVDKQHSTMARIGLSSPAKLELEEDTLNEFEEAFGVSWETALHKEQVFGVVEVTLLPCYHSPHYLFTH